MVVVAPAGRKGSQGQPQAGHTGFQVVGSALGTLLAVAAHPGPQEPQMQWGQGRVAHPVHQEEVLLLLGQEE
jgi:hypothetical protein